MALITGKVLFFWNLYYLAPGTPLSPAPHPASRYAKAPLPKTGTVPSGCLTKTRKSVLAVTDHPDSLLTIP